MKCIGYDADFQRNLAEKFPAFVPKPRNQPSGKNAKKSRVAKDRPATKTGQKRKRVEVESSDTESGDVIFEDSDVPVEVVVSASRGTRSRPNHAMDL